MEARCEQASSVVCDPVFLGLEGERFRQLTHLVRLMRASLPLESVALAATTSLKPKNGFSSCYAPNITASSLHLPICGLV